MTRVSFLVLCGLVGLAGVATAVAQTVASPSEVVWSTFVAGTGRASQRVPRDVEPGTLELPDTPWECGFARPRFAQISDQDWSVQRVLACRRDQATVSATATCRVRNGELEEHAATLSLGTVGRREHVTVTLSCGAR